MYNRWHLLGISWHDTRNPGPVNLLMNPLYPSLVKPVLCRILTLKFPLLALFDELFV